MATFDKTQLNGIVSQIAASQPSKADAAIDYAHAHLKAVNRVNARYLGYLKSAESVLKKIDKLQQETEDAAEAAGLKADLRAR